MTASIHETIHAAKSGDTPALQSLFGRNLPQLMAFLRLRMGKLVSAKESVSDLAQSVCREVLEDLDGFEYRGEEAFRKFLFMQAMRKILDRKKYYTRDRRDAVREVDVHAQSRGDDEGERESLLGAYASIYSPSKHASGQELLERIEGALHELPEQQREAVALSRLMELSYPEVAEQMGLSESAVRGLVARGLAKLTLVLGPDVS